MDVSIRSWRLIPLRKSIIIMLVLIFFDREQWHWILVVIILGSGE